MNFIDLIGKHVLVVEDDYLQASNITLALEDQGSDVIGPFPDLESSLLNLETARIDVAVLDIHLGKELIYPVADRLEQARIPFVFATGANESAIPDRFSRVRRLLKPFSLEELAVELAILVADRKVTWQ